MPFEKFGGIEGPPTPPEEGEEEKEGVEEKIEEGPEEIGEGPGKGEENLGKISEEIGEKEDFILEGTGREHPETSLEESEKDIKTGELPETRLGPEKKESEKIEDEKIFIEFQARENEMLEKTPSRFKKLFASVTAAAILMMSTPAFAESPKPESKISEPTKIELRTETREVKSMEEIRLSADLEKSGYSLEEISNLLEFTKENKIPVNDLITASEKMNESSDKLTLLQTYAIAYDAVFNNKLSSDMKERFETNVLPHLKNGIVDIIKVQKEDIKGADAIYDGKNDAYKTTGINLKQPGDRSITIHELTHLSQDALKLIQKREDSEHEAYKTQSEYLMREANLIREGEEKEIIFSRPLTIEEIKTEYEKLIIYEHALKNAEKDKNNLNIISEVGVNLSSLDKEEAIDFYKVRIKDCTELLKSMWASGTNFSSMISGKRIDTNEVLIKNGLERLDKQNYEE